MIFQILNSAYSPREKFILIVSFIISVMFAIIIHEYAHAWVAVKNGDLTPKLAGRLTLSPLAHFSLFGLLMFFLIGFGWAKPVPINPDNFENKKKGNFLTSIAGVTANLLNAMVSLACLCLVVYITRDNFYNGSEFVFTLNLLFFNIFYYSILLNMSLMLFNLIPVYPLDGFRVVETLSKPQNKFVNFMYKYGSLGLIVVLLIISFIPDKYNMFSLFLGEVQKLVMKIILSIG